MVTYVIPYRVVGKTRLGDSGLAEAMMSDVLAAYHAQMGRLILELVPLYGPGSADRFVVALQATRLELPGLRDDVDTWDDLERVRDRVGPNTRTYLEDRA